MTPVLTHSSPATTSALRALQPLLRWPGGKSAELDHVWPHIPPHARYVEPFIGGGALFFALAPRTAVIGDTHPLLTDFYRRLGAEDGVLAQALRNLVRAWECLGVAAAVVAPGVALRSQMGATPGGRDVTGAVEWAMEQLEPSWTLLPRAFPQLRGGDLEAAVERSVTDKLARIARAEVRTGRRWPEHDVTQQMETAVRAGFYTFMRDGFHPATAGEATMRFFFEREFSYGAMFRCNRDGHSNVPYGGRSYNHKDFAAKVEYALSPEVRELLGRSDIHTGSWEDTLSADLDRDDFVFLDPPYDTAFHTYDGQDFTAHDHEQVADYIRATRARCCLVVQRTPLMERLYRQRAARFPLRIHEYPVMYTTNTRNRNARAAVHWIVRNY